MLVLSSAVQENAMAPTPNRPDAAESDERLDEQPPQATPDEDGPHDVPDEKVIEKTMPKPSRQDH
jgi:hypothetical protein